MANSADPDEMAHYELSHLHLHFLHRLTELRYLNINDKVNVLKFKQQKVTKMPKFRTYLFLSVKQREITNFEKGNKLSAFFSLP